MALWVLVTSQCAAHQIHQRCSFTNLCRSIRQRTVVRMERTRGKLSADQVVSQSCDSANGNLQAMKCFEDCQIVSCLKEERQNVAEQIVVQEMGWKLTTLNEATHTGAIANFPASLGRDKPIVSVLWIRADEP